MIQAYEGKDPYIFVSYAHKDNAAVFRIIEQLSARGYRIWYDEGIEPGAEWPEYIANHLVASQMVISFLTPNSVNSLNCRREINYALSKNKPLLTIHLQKMEIPAGLELQLSSQQSILYYNYDSEERFLDKVETCQHLKPCRRKEFETETPAGQMASESTSSRREMSPAKIAIAAGACVAVLVVFLLIGNGNKTDAVQESSGEAATVQSVTETKSENSSGSDAQDGSGSDAQDGSGTAQNDAASGQNSGSDAAVGNWNYTIHRTEESTTYSFARGPQIVLPASWGQITVLEEGDMVGFYHTASKEAWEAKGYENTGYLFKLGLDPTQEYKSLPSYMDLGKTSEGYFYLMFPTDFQGYADNERIREQYQTMSSELTYVKMNSYISE